MIEGSGKREEARGRSHSLFPLPNSLIPHPSSSHTIPISRPRANLRLFVAAYPPPEVARELIDALRDLELPPHRLVPVDQVHLTLQFIGDVPQERLAPTIETVQRVSAGLSVFELALIRLIALPQRPPARLVAAESDRPATLLELKRRLASRLAHGPRRRSDDRFRPHFTLCRLKAPAAIRDLDAPPGLPSFVVRRVVLMRSTLAPDGARHHEVATCDLE